MSDIIEYKIVHEDDERYLDEVVAEYLAKGWQPLSGPYEVPYFTEDNEFSSISHQAMVKYRKGSK